MDMKIDHQTLRVRISEAELRRLLDGESLRDATFGLQSECFARELSLSTDGAAKFAWQSDGPPAQQAWKITLPRVEVVALSQRLPSKEGLAFSWPAAEQAHDPDTRAERLTVVLEVDLHEGRRPDRVSR